MGGKEGGRQHDVAREGGERGREVSRYDTLHMDDMADS